MAKTYFSNASWSKIKDSQDSHSHCDSDEKNHAYAESICDQLLYKWGEGGHLSPCEIRGVCLKTWVTDEDGKVITEV